MMLPATIAPNADLAETIRDAASRVLEYLDPMTDIPSVVDLRVRWEAFVSLVNDRRRRSTARAEEVARRIELRIGELVEDKKASEVRQLTANEVTVFRTMWRFRDVVEEVISRSTNAAPATRNRVMTTIRWHRTQLGEMKHRKSVRVPPDARQLTLARAMAIIEQEENQALARSVGGDASVVYQRIRQALAVLGQMPPDGAFSVRAELLSILTTAEKYAVELLREQRVDS